MRRTAGALCAALVLPVAAWAIEIGELDDFEGATTEGWRHGGPSPNPPSVVGSGGPDGAGDGYLRIPSTGSFSPGGRLIAFNTEQWTGDYVAAGVTAIAAHARVLDGPGLPLRIAIESTTSRYGSTDAIVLPNDGAWHDVLFDLAEMSLIAGPGTLEETLANVQSIRVLAADGLTWQGDPIDADLGIDDLEARASSVSVDPMPLVSIARLAPRPNPFRGSTVLAVGLDIGGTFSLHVFDAAGRHVRTRGLGHLGAGTHEVSFDAAGDLPAGVWYLRLAPTTGASRTIRVVKIP